MVDGQEPVSNLESVPENDNSDIFTQQFDSNLNVAAAIFAPKLNAHQYVVGTSTAARDLLHVQEVQAGGVGHQGQAAGHLWDKTQVQPSIEGNLTKDAKLL